MKRMTIQLATEFSRYPMGRYRKDGPKTGEHFRDDVLRPALADPNAAVTIELDGVVGYGSSFLEEAFGGLIRKGMPLADFMRRVALQSRDATLIDEILGYVRDAAK